MVPENCFLKQQIIFYNNVG